MRRSDLQLWGASVVLAVCVQAAHAQSGQSGQAAVEQPVFVEAQRAEVRGDYKRAEGLYGESIAADATNTEALLGRARMRSWQGEFSGAITDYQSVLHREADHPRALSGLGWTYAWNHNFDEARRTFEHLAQVEPYYLDAKKGLAYVELWRGNARSARTQFEALAREDQGNPEYVVAIGQAAYLDGDLDRARSAFHEALTLKPGLEAARTGLEAVDTAAIQRRPAVTLLYGRSETGDVTHTGIRFAQFAIQPTPKARWWLTYDRGVGFDGFSPDRRLENAATTTVGGFFNFTPHTGTRIEAGVRDLPEETQPVISAEQVWFLSGGWTPKVAVWAAKAEDATEWVFSGSVHKRLNSRFSLEPTVYFGDDGSTREVRGAVLGTYTAPNRMEIGLGFALGTKDTPTGNLDVSRVFANFAMPITQRVRFVFYGWQEKTQTFDDTLVLAAGLTVSL